MREVKPGSSVYILDDVISDELCNTLKIVIDKSNCIKMDLEPGNNVICEYIDVAMLENKKFAKIIDKEIFTVICDIIKRAQTHNAYIGHISKDEGYCLRKITGPTRTHADSVFPTNGERLVKSAAYDIRKLSLIIALNGDYEGGEFFFPNHDIEVKLKKRQAIIFPPYWTHPHGTKELNNNTYRYTLNTWLTE